MGLGTLFLLFLVSLISALPAWAQEDAVGSVELAETLTDQGTMSLKGREQGKRIYSI
jgi:hypothetical protein